jgi:hypothetical protein
MPRRPGPRTRDGFIVYSEEEYRAMMALAEGVSPVAVTSYEPGPDGKPPWTSTPFWGTPRRAFAGVMLLLLLILGARSCVAESQRPTAAITPTAEQAVAATVAPLQLPTSTPVTGVEQPTAGAIAAPTATRCPPGSPLEASASPGWLGRAAGCPELLFALVNGEQRWVQRPAGFPDDLYRQLPELQP